MTTAGNSTTRCAGAGGTGRAQEEMPDRGDPYGRMTEPFQPNDSNFITYHAVVSTSPDQIAISPGDLKRAWQQDGRKYFEYSMGSTKIQNFFSFISGNMR